MKLTQYSAHGGQLSKGTLIYECLEMGEFERASAEARAFSQIFGQPSQDQDPNIPLLIVGYDRQKVKQQLQLQRSRPDTCLRPIVVAGINEQGLDADLLQLADWVLPPQADQDQLIETRSGIELLVQQVASLPQVRDDRVMNLLQFMHSRVLKLAPVVDPDAVQAYRYPLAECLLAQSGHALTELLEDLAQHEIFNRKHVDRLFTCPSCSDYRVSVKEQCPQCGSTHLSCQESIHHFRCGYVAPESEFMVKGRPQCPKCHGDIQHIGVEYNRPGQFVVCGDCHYWASEPTLSAWCSMCNSTHDPADLIPININGYRLHSNAMRIARQGSWQADARENPPSPRQTLDSDDSNGLSLKAEPADKPRHDRQRPTRTKRGVVNAITQLIHKVAREQDEPTQLYRIEWNAEEIDATAVKRMLQAFTKEALMCVDIEQNEPSLSVILKSEEASCPSPAELENCLNTAFGETFRVTSEETISEHQSEHQSHHQPANAAPVLSAG